MSIRDRLSKRAWFVAGASVAYVGGVALARTAINVAKQRIYSRINRDVSTSGQRVWDLPKTLTSEQWKEDLRCLAEELPRQLIYFDTFVSRQEFSTMVSELSQKIPFLTRDQIILELMKIVALPKAGHTKILPWQPAIDWRVLPIRLYLFDDGVYVTHASKRYRDTIGSRVVKIGNADIERVLTETIPYVAADNDVHAKHEFCSYIVPFPEVFKAFGYTDNADKTRFTLEDSAGMQIDVDVRSLSLASPSAFPDIWPLYTHDGGVRPPAVINDRSERYWFEYWTDSKTIYFQLNAVQNQPNGESIADLTQRLGKFVDGHEIERFIVDLRHNGGGDNTLVAPLVELLSGNERINQRGRLFTIIDRETFSAAVSFATALERRTKTLFVGEPSGGQPNTIGDPEPSLVLPNSKIIVRVSWRWWQQSAPDDERRWIFPDVSVPITHGDYFSGHDRAVEAIFSYQAAPHQEVELDDGQIERYVGRYLFNPNQLLIVGRDNGHLHMAITDFEEFVKCELYPVSVGRLATDITDVELRLSATDSAPTIHWKGVETPLFRVAEEFLLPIQLLRAGKLDEAIKRFREDKEDGVRLDSRFEMAMYDIVLKYLRAKDYDNAMKVGGLVVDMLPLSAHRIERTMIEVGRDHIKLGEYGSAIDTLGSSLELFPDSASAYTVLAEAYMIDGNRRLAVASCENALELDPDATEAKRMLRRLRRSRQLYGDLR